MGIKDFLKNLLKGEKPEPIKVELSKLPDFIKTKEEESQAKNKDFLKSINKLIRDLIYELKPKIKVLEDIDISEKKIEEKIKFIVSQNLENYIVHLKKLINRLEGIISESPSNLINHINIMFNNFEKSSSMSYEKATFIVGKEIGDVVNCIADFSKDFQSIIKGNKNLILTSQTFNLVKEKLNEFEKQEDVKKEIDKKISEIDREIGGLRERRKFLEREIEKIEESEGYKKEIGMKKDIEEKERKLEREILLIKQLIDFKTLTNFCHSNEKEMNIIKEHKDNFLENFQKDRKVILGLLKDAKLLSSEIEKKVDDVIRMSREIKEFDDNLELRYSVDISLKESEIDNMERKIESLLNQLNKEKKRIEKIKIVIDNIREEIRQESGKIGIEIRS